MAVVTISRQFGAGGHALGESVAKTLGYQLVDRQIIRRVADAANVSVDWVMAMEKEAGGKLMPFLSRMVSKNFIERLLPEGTSDFDDQRYIVFLQKVIRSIGDEGDVVILGQGAQFILPNKPDTFKFLLVADWEDRVRYFQELFSLERDKAANVLERESRRRDAFLSRLDPRDPNDPGLYNLIINTSRVSLNYASRLVTDLVQSRGA